MKTPKLPEWWKPASGGISGPPPPFRPWPKSVATPHFLVSGRGGFVTILEEDGPDCWSDAVRGSGGNRLTYAEGRALAHGLENHPGPLATELAQALHTFLDGASDTDPKPQE